MSKAKHKPENPIHLRAYIGLGNNGQPAIVISQGKLNPLGTRCEKGTPFPDVLYEWLGSPEWLTASAALQALQGYFDQLAKR